MFISDREIKNLCCFHNQQHLNMIQPFHREQVREVAGRKVISYGLSSYGYDMRLSSRDFRVFKRVPGQVVDPKDFDVSTLSQAELMVDEQGGEYFILPAHTYALGVSVEKFNLPGHVTGICLGKSTYARVGVIVNITPLEAGWTGYLTIEISNSSCADIKIYANEGIAQVLFSLGNPCMTTYADRAGKYQGQGEEVTIARM